MEVNFDKQIDTILRDLAQGNSFADSPSSHLDADELSAFAENVLPPKARLRAMEHLADCSNCRKTLTTFFSLDNETQSETIHEEVKTIAAIPKIPWYRKLFAFPQLSYAMGALALILTGTIGLILWQGAQDSGSSIAMKEPAAEKAKGPSGASSEGDTPTYETYSANSSNTVANAAAPASNAASSVMNSAANTSFNSTSPTTTGSGPADSAPKPLATPVLSESPVRGITLDAPSSDKLAANERDRKAAKEDVVASKGGETNQPEFERSPTPTPSARQQSEDNMGQQRAEVPVQNRATQNNIIMPDGEAKRSAPSAPPAAKKVPSQREDSGSGNYAKDEEAKKNKVLAKSAPTKDVAGKTFRSENGMWVDSAYRGGSTINVKRSSAEYKKLDSGLRSTADYLGGTVIIVWKSKNYKIQ